MALTDWNGDGRNDLTDDYIEYQIYKDVTSSGGHSSGPVRRSSFGLLKFVLAIIILIVIVEVYDASRPKCACPDCDNSPEEGSHYCLLHDPDRYKGLGSKTPVITTTTTTSPETTTSYRTTTRRKTAKTTTRETDEYNAHDYYFPEDFYEDHYDDFFDYEDAEDYWEENN